MYKRQLYNKDDRQAEDATTGISARSFSNISSSLSTVYKNDDGIYGNNGYPVLVWQEAVDESEKVYMEEIPEDVQRELDAYLAENAETSLYGHSIVRLFSLSSYINDALITYNAVSYTHLDVYKRQCLTKTKTTTSRQW